MPPEQQILNDFLSQKTTGRAAFYFYIFILYKAFPLLFTGEYPREEWFNANERMIDHKQA